MNYFAGIDVSKATLDVSIYNSQKQVFYSKFGNNAKGYKLLLSWLKENPIKGGDTLFCMENTGVYNCCLALYLSSRALNVWIVMPIEIKRSMGLQRGKNDKIDSVRIVRYASKHYDGYTAKQTPDIIFRLKDWLSCREKLIKQLKQLQQPVNEFESMG